MRALNLVLLYSWTNLFNLLRTTKSFCKLVAQSYNSIHKIVLTFVISFAASTKNWKMINRMPSFITMKPNGISQKNSTRYLKAKNLPRTRGKPLKLITKSPLDLSMRPRASIKGKKVLRTITKRILLMLWEHTKIARSHWIKRLKWESERLWCLLQVVKRAIAVPLTAKSMARKNLQNDQRAHNK